ncbi:MAG: acetyl-CoA carboxylase biotin carboxyl carrier protein [Lachnospiraceae bacterium]|nr:acetyl-CoA carboxylase biotin carboxyl carrier protein [Lachnospiraceae bacterium]
MEYNQILELVREVSNAGLSSFEYKEGDVAISMSCPDTSAQAIVQAQTVANATQGVAVAKAETNEPAIIGKVVKSPLVGTFYVAPEEGADPFVSVGDHVSKGETLAIVEAMKLMNEIECEFEGTVAKILVENGEMVEYGQPLFEIKE